MSIGRGAFRSVVCRGSRLRATRNIAVNIYDALGKVLFAVLKIQDMATILPLTSAARIRGFLLSHSRLLGTCHTHGFGRTVNPVNPDRTETIVCWGDVVAAGRFGERVATASRARFVGR